MSWVVPATMLCFFVSLPPFLCFYFGILNSATRSRSLQTSYQHQGSRVQSLGRQDFYLETDWTAHLECNDSNRQNERHQCRCKSSIKVSPYLALIYAAVSPSPSLIQFCARFPMFGQLFWSQNFPRVIRTHPSFRLPFQDQEFVSQQSLRSESS